MSCCKECTCGTQPTEERRAAIDSQIILDMSRQIAEREEEISRCWEEIRELQMTSWQRFKRWIGIQWNYDIYHRAGF
jgi:hypothetical protein